MTDRIKALTVELRDDIRDDDCDALVSAIMMIKGVVKVSKHVEDWEHRMAVYKAKREIVDQIYGILK